MDALNVETMISVIFRSRPVVHFIPKGTVEFAFGDDHFEDLELGYHNGFYNFLRSRRGAIIGLRLIPDPAAETSLAEIPDGEYAICK
jgi:hypothetical protein